MQSQTQTEVVLKKVCRIARVKITGISENATDAVTETMWSEPKFLDFIMILVNSIHLKFPKTTLELQVFPLFS